MIARFRQPPLDQGDPARILSSQMDELITRKSHIDKLWTGAWKAIRSPSRTNKTEVKGQATAPVQDDAKNVPDKVRKSSVKTTPPDHTPQERTAAAVPKKGTWDGTPSPAHKTVVTMTTVNPPPLSNGSIDSKQSEASHVTIATEESDVVPRKVRSKVIPKEQVSVTRVSKKYTNRYGELEEEAYKVSHVTVM